MDPEDPKYAPAAVLARQNTMIGVTIAMTLVGALAVGLRVFTRAYIVGTMWADDWAMIAALAFAFGYALEVIIAAKSFNAGFSGADLSPDDVKGIIQITAAVVVTYKLVLTLTKVSILCFYLRIAVRPTFRRLSKWTLGVVVLFQVILTFTTIGQCVPIEKMWDVTAKGRCIDANTFYHFASGFHIVTDVWILCLPAKLVLSIPRPFKEKMGLFGVFSLGFITVVAAIFRLQFLHAFTISPDPFFEIVPIHIWSMVEVHIGILCASLPTLRPLFSRAQRLRTRGKSLTAESNPVNGFANEKGTLATSGTIPFIMGATIRGSYRPPVPPKSPSYAGSDARSSPTFHNSPLYNSYNPFPIDTNKLSPHYNDTPSPLFSKSKSKIGKSFEADLERNMSSAGTTKKLALLRRDENGIFRPEAVYTRAPCI